VFKSYIYRLCRGKKTCPWFMFRVSRT